MIDRRWGGYLLTQLPSIPSPGPFYRTQSPAFGIKVANVVSRLTPSMPLLASPWDGADVNKLTRNVRR